jgi:hypothetical protein
MLLTAMLAHFVYSFSLQLHTKGKEESSLVAEISGCLVDVQTQYKTNNRNVSG